MYVGGLGLAVSVVLGPAAGGGEPGETVESSTTVIWVKWLHEQVAVVSDVPVRVQPASEYVSEAVSQYTQRSRARLFVFCSADIVKGYSTGKVKTMPGTCHKKFNQCQKPLTNKSWRPRTPSSALAILKAKTASTCINASRILRCKDATFTGAFRKTYHILDLFLRHVGLEKGEI